MKNCFKEEEFDIQGVTENISHPKRNPMNYLLGHIIASTHCTGNNFFYLLSMRANKITDKLSVLTKAGRKLKYREEEIKSTFGDLD